MLVTILTSVASGLIGALLSTYIYIRREKRKFKMDTLKKFASNRFDLKSEEFSRALNEIYVVFNDNERVIKALQDLHGAIVGKQGNEIATSHFVKLYKEMCKDLSVDYSNLNDSFFLTPFNTKASSLGQG